MHVAIATAVEDDDKFMRTNALANAKLATAMRTMSLIAYDSWGMTDDPDALFVSINLERSARAYSMRCIFGATYSEKIGGGDIFN